MKTLLPYGFIQCIVFLASIVLVFFNRSIHETSEQHVEQRESRIKRALMDLATLQDWFEDHSPFANFTELMSIANGVTASEESQVNCDEAEQIGAKIQQSLDDV